VCGGYNECGSRLIRETAVIKLVFGLMPDWYGSSQAQYGKAAYDKRIDLTLTEVQYHLVWVCDQLNGRDDIIQVAKSRCWWTKFAAWLTDSRNKALHNLTTVSFPLPSNEVYRALYYFMQDNGLYDLMGFNTADVDDGGLRLVWWAFELRAARVFVDDDIITLRKQYDFWNVIMSNINTPSWYAFPFNLTAFMVSDTWVEMFTQTYAISGATYTVSIGGTICILIVFVVSCSLTLTVLTTCTLTTSVVMCLGIFKTAGWTLGPIEQVALSLLLGMCSEHTMHILEGYLEYLHSAQSHILARDTTRLQAYRGMLLRAGVPISFSGLTMICLSLLQLGSSLFIFRKVALILITVIAVSVSNNLIFLGGMLCAVGPTASFRNMTMMSVLFVFLSIVVLVLVLFLLYGVGLEDPEGNRLAG
jgi:hypothetical protein